MIVQVHKWPFVFFLFDNNVLTLYSLHTTILVKKGTFCRNTLLFLIHQKKDKITKTRSVCILENLFSGNKDKEDAYIP
jgi:hypothetical protein